jgi:hypothetical protein
MISAVLLSCCKAVSQVWLSGNGNSVKSVSGRTCITWVADARLLLY